MRLGCRGEARMACRNRKSLGSPYLLAVPLTVPTARHSGRSPTIGLASNGRSQIY